MSIRILLQNTTDTFEAEKHRGQITVISYKYPHSIEWLESPQPINQYTCIVHALDFIGYKPYENIAARFHDVYVGPEFLHFLLEMGIFEEIKNPKKGNLAFYSDNGKIKHAGVYVDEDTIESKWGQGNLWRHKPFEVPSSYGDHVNCYLQLPKEEVIEYFLDFAETKGVEF
jgi:hypothetical protein